MSGKLFSHVVRDFFLVDVLGGENYPNKIKSLTQKIANLGGIINAQRQQIYNQKQVIKQAYKLVRRYERYIEHDITYSDPVAIDFHTMDVVSIERQVAQDKNNTLPFTTIGYKVDGREIQEWYLYCDRAQHARLVEQFNEYLRSKAKI